MALHDMLHDRKSQASSTRCPGATLIDTIESLAQKRDVLCGDTFTVVDNSEAGFTFGVLLPRNPDLCSRSGVANGIADQVNADAGDF